MTQFNINIIKAHLLFASVLFMYSSLYAQLPTYTVDEDFNTNNLFRSSSGVSDILIIEDDRILVGGGFDNDWNESSFNGLGMIWENGTADDNWMGGWSSTAIQVIKQDDGYIYPNIQSLNKRLLNGDSWYAVHGDWWGDYFEGGNTNPYNVESIWRIYQQDDGKLLIGGAIATDTLQPGLFRCLSRIHADGTHDPTFPIIEAEPASPNTSVKRIQRASNGYWYISGAFESINGHETHHIARLTPEFEVDTDFVSPFVFGGLNSYQPQLVLLDSQDRLWVSGERVRLLENPDDTLQVIRLLPDGNVDLNFNARDLGANYPEELSPWGRAIELRGIVELENNPMNYLVHGYFNSLDGATANCITVVNDFGEIQEHFFQSQGATINDWNNSSVSGKVPTIGKVVELDNGDLLVGGAFSQFMGSTHYNMIKLKLGVLGTEDQSALNQKFKLWPNPANQFVNISFEGLVSGTVKIMNLTGQVVETYQMLGGFSTSRAHHLRLDTSELPKGIYFVVLETEEGNAIKKMVVN